MPTPDQTTRLRQAAHDAATEAWGETNRRSRTAGLAEMARGQKRPQRTSEQRARMQLAHKDKLRASAAKALGWSIEHRPWNPRHLDRSMYFPHQSDREINRGARKCA